MGRAGNNEGAIYHRAIRNEAGEIIDKRWEAKLSLPGGRRKSLYGRTRAEVAQKLTAAKRDRDQGLPIVDDRQTVGQYLAWWLDAIQADLKPRTYTRYEGEVRNHLVPELGALRLSKLSAPRLQTLYSELLREGYAPATVAHLHAVVHKALDMAMRLGYVQRNVAELADAPSARKHRQEMHPLNQEQAQTLLDAARGERLEALYVLALSTGMREGELLALSWADVDLDGAVLQVRHTLHHEGDGRWALTEPKTAKSKRRIELMPSTVEALRAHRLRQLGERMAAGPAWQDHNLVFTRPRCDGEPLRGTHLLAEHFRPLLQRAGLPPTIRFHDLRHTCATLLLADGMNVKVVSEMLGHSDISMTLGIYGHVLPGMHKQAAAAMERLLTTRQGRG